MFNVPAIFYQFIAFLFFYYYFAILIILISLFKLKHYGNIFHLVYFKNNFETNVIIIKILFSKWRFGKKRKFFIKKKKFCFTQF